MLKSSLCDYSGAYILVKETIIRIGQRTDLALIQTDRNDKKVIFKSSARLMTV